ncbi:MAG: hypothetical protein LN561_01950 [Rickettsia endosymbiont of Labidopullus appendiculatus]|nr:hypothetical protein [Rickettsia endosymbiont of Labidopullus appendiculatus]
MSLPEPTEILSKIAQFQAEITNEQNIFDEANRVCKSLQKDIENKQIELESLKEHWQEQDNDALKSLTKLWQQQAEIKKQLSDWSENGIKKAIEEQTTTLKTQLNEIESEYKIIRTEISAREKFNLFLQGDKVDIDLIDQDTKDTFSELVAKGNKEELFKKNSQDIAALNAMIIDLEKEHESLTKQEQKLKDYSLDDNLAYNTELQKLFEERQTDITKKIDSIISQQDDSELKRQYESIKSQEEEIKFIQNKIEEKNQIIKQTKQKEEELLAKLEQLQQESLIPQFSSKQEREEIVNQYPILQERANDIAASIERQIELNKLNALIKQQGEEIRSEKNKADSLAQQLKELELSANNQIRDNLIVIEELREKIKGLEEEKEQQLITPQGPNLAEELERIGEPNKLVQLEKQIGELTEENDGLKASLKTLETLSAEKDEKLKVIEEGYRKELSKQLAQTSIDVAKLQVVNEELSTLKIQTDNLTKENDGLKASLKTLETLSAEKDKELKVAEENHKEELNRQSQQSEAELLGVKGELSQLKSEKQKIQEELGESQQIVKKLQESLSVESNHSKELQTQMGKLTTDNSKLQNELNAEKEEYEKKLSEQSQQTKVKLQETSEKLLQLETQLGLEQQGRKS